MIEKRFMEILKCILSIEFFMILIKKEYENLLYIWESCVAMNDTDFENLRKMIKFLRNKIVKN